MSFSGLIRENRLPQKSWFARQILIRFQRNVLTVYSLRFEFRFVWVVSVTLDVIIISGRWNLEICSGEWMDGIWEFVQEGGFRNRKSIVDNSRQ